MIGVSRKFTPKDLNPSGWWDCTLQNDNSLNILPLWATGTTDIANSFGAALGTDDYRREWQFDGTQTVGSTFVVQNASQIQPIVQGSHSVFLRIKYNSFSTVNQFFGFTVGTTTLICWYDNSANQIKWRVNSSGTPSGADASWTPSLNTWYNVCITRDGNNLQFIIDGTSLSLTYANQSSISAECTALGMSTLGILHRQTTLAGSIQATDGDLDSFFIKNALLTQNEIDLLNGYYTF